MPAIAMTCPVCKHKSRVADREVCLGVRCEKCADSFMEAERVTDFSAMDWEYGKRRKKSGGTHPLALVWLILMIVGNASAALLMIILTAVAIASGPGGAVWFFLVSATLCLTNVVCAIALLFHKVWGFSAFCLVQVIAVILSIVVSTSSGGGVTLGVPFVLSTVVGAVVASLILYGVLRVGNPSTWSQLD